MLREHLNNKLMLCNFLLIFVFSLNRTGNECIRECGSSFSWVDQPALLYLDSIPMPQGSKRFRHCPYKVLLYWNVTNVLVYFLSVCLN